MHIAGLIPLYGRKKTGGPLVVLGQREPIGGERSKYTPHQGKQEIARRVKQEWVLIGKYRSALDRVWGNADYRRWSHG